MNQQAGWFCGAENGDDSLAGFPIAYGTAHMALVHRGNLKPGEKVLISGAAGGVGLAAVQVVACPLNI